jgi:hypothetical protein
MTDLVSKIKGARNFFENIVAAIPGFKGYVERSNRRDADKLLRATIASRYEEQWSRISELQRRLVAEGQIEQVDDLEAAVMKLRMLVDRVRHAAYGYSGFFDAVKVNEPELNKLYEYDSALLDKVAQVTSAVDNVSASIGSDGLPAAIRNLAALAQECVDTFERRGEVILASG